MIVNPEKDIGKKDRCGKVPERSFQLLKRRRPKATAG
jgi:hypothetical protein